MVRRKLKLRGSVDSVLRQASDANAPTLDCFPPLSFVPPFLLRDVDLGVPIYTFTGHNSKVHCLALTNNGECIISGAEDKTVKVWKISSQVRADGG